LLPGAQPDRGNDRHDVGHAQLRDQRGSAQPSEEHAAEPAASGRNLMSVSGVTNRANPYALPEETISVSEAGQLSNQFITLMVAQIQNQDPTNPVDSNQFVEQYATISQVQIGRASCRERG